MSADVIVKRALSEVPSAVAAGIVDMGSGMLVAVKTVDSHPQAVLDLLASATKDLFEGSMVTQIEGVFKKARGVNGDERYFQEVLVSSTNLWHYFARLKSNSQAVVGVVCRADANVGLVLMRGREIVKSETL
jgi:hypothetical protein